MRKHKTRLALVAGVAIFFALFSAARALGQGGTGRETINTNANNAGPPSNVKSGTRTARTTGATRRRASLDESSYVPKGPTAKEMIFLRDFLKANGQTNLPQAEMKTGQKTGSSFLPLDECKGRIIETRSRRNRWLGDLFFFDFDAYTFSFSDIDPSQIKAELIRIEETGGDKFNSRVGLQTSNDRKAIRHQSGYLLNGPINSDNQSSDFAFLISDNEKAENQAQVMTALKRLIATCTGRQ